MTPFALIGAANAAVWFCVFLILHVLRWRSGRARASWLLRTYAWTLIAAIVTTVATVSGAGNLLAVSLAMIVTLLTSVSLFALYLPAVYVVLTSISVQTIVLLRESGGTLPLLTLYNRFAGPAIVAERLTTLAESGYLKREAQVFCLTPRGRRVARLFRWMKGAWRLGPGG